MRAGIIASAGVAPVSGGPGLVQVNSGTWNGTGFTTSLPVAATGLVIVHIASNTVITTPGGWTLRNSTVNYMGNYLFDRPGSGGTSWAFTTGASQGTWTAIELAAGAAFVSASTNPASGDTGASSGTTHTSPSVIPTAGKRGILSAIRSLSDIGVASFSGWAAGWDEIADVAHTAGDRPAQGVGWIEVAADGTTAYSSGTIGTGRTSTGRSGLTAVYALP